MRVRLHHMARQLGQWVSYRLHRRRCIQCHRLYDFEPVGLFDPRTGEAVLKTIPMCRRCELVEMQPAVSGFAVFPAASGYLSPEEVLKWSSDVLSPGAYKCNYRPPASKIRT